MTKSVLILAGLILLACGNDRGGEGLRLTLVTGAGINHELTVEVADTVESRSRGLTGRTSLAENDGMLFVIEQRGRGFWMKDVPIPLSVAFIAACGEIVAIVDMEARSEEFHNTEHAYQFGLEVNLGWFKVHDIVVGDLVQLPASPTSDVCP